MAVISAFYREPWDCTLTMDCQVQQQVCCVIITVCRCAILWAYWAIGVRPWQSIDFPSFCSPQPLALKQFVMWRTSESHPIKQYSVICLVFYGFWYRKTLTELNKSMKDFIYLCAAAAIGIYYIWGGGQYLSIYKCIKEYHRGKIATINLHLMHV